MDFSCFSRECLRVSSDNDEHLDIFKRFLRIQLNLTFTKMTYDEIFDFIEILDDIHSLNVDPKYIIDSIIYLCNNESFIQQCYQMNLYEFFQNKIRIILSKKTFYFLNSFQTYNNYIALIKEICYLFCVSFVWILDHLFTKKRYSFYKKNHLLSKF
jgi:hypothetical protein